MPSITRSVVDRKETLKFKIASENLKIDAGGDNKLWIQFASPNRLYKLHVLVIFTSCVGARMMLQHINTDYYWKVLNFQSC